MSDLDRLAKEAMVLSLDVGNIDEAEKLVEEVGDFFSYAKVGSELYAESGAQAIERLMEKGIKVFLDLKLHDIPNTVERACKVHASRGISMMTVHASGGKEMLEAARRGLDQGSSQNGFEPPILLGVTVLTSLPADDIAFNERLDLIADAGCDLVCSALELEVVRSKAPGVRALVPGIRLAGQEAQDQRRVATPSSAIKDGAKWIVLGRAVHGEENPKVAAEEVFEEVKNALKDQIN